MLEYILYRVMSEEEFEKLMKFGFFSIEFFKKWEKHFTPNEEYAWIVGNTNFGNNKFKEKYSVIVKFYIRTLKEIPCKFVEFRFLDCVVRDVKKPNPLVVFLNKKGEIVEVYRFIELEKMTINPNRILYIDEIVLKCRENYKTRTLYKMQG